MPLENNKEGLLNFHDLKEGMTVGTRQGLIICGVLLCLLLFFSIFDFGYKPWIGRTLDLTCALFTAVAFTYVVGGTVSYKTKIGDAVLKATGGAAILLIIIFFYQPYTETTPSSKWPISLDFREHMCLGDIIDLIDDERAIGIHKYQFEFQSDENEIRQFRPVPPLTSRVYNGKAWDEIFTKFDVDSKCLRTVINNNLISLEIESAKTKEKYFKKEDGTAVTLRFCK